MIYKRCKAGAVRCVHKGNSDIGIVTCRHETPIDAYGSPCIFLSKIETVD